MSQLIDIKVPDIGDYTDVPVIEVLVKAGDRVENRTTRAKLQGGKYAYRGFDRLGRGV